MPIYEFQCKKCGYIFEEIHKTLVVSCYCPVCEEKGKKSIAKKILSRSNFNVKGFNARNGYSNKAP